MELHFGTMNILLFIVVTSFLHICIFATPSRLRVKRKDISTVKTIESGDEEKTTAPNFSSTVQDVFGETMNADSGEGRIRISIQYSFDELTTNCSNNNCSEVMTTTEATIDLSHLTREFLNCTHICIEPECYEKLDNGSVYAPLYDRAFDISNYIIRENRLFICPDFFGEVRNTDVFPHTLSTVAEVCACISTAFIILHIIMFMLVKELRNLPDYCMLSLCFALVGTYLCTFVQYYLTDYVCCRVIGMFLVYFFLASFFWMNTMAYDIWKSVRMATTKFRLTTNRPFVVQLIPYSFYAWGTPVMIILLSIIIHYSANETSKLRLEFNPQNCFFKYKQALTLYFAGPLFTLLGMNVLLFAWSFYMISSASMSNSQSGTQGRSSDLRSRLLKYLTLASAMGLMWIFGIIAIITKENWIWYLYSACSALQGVFIFFGFTVRKRVRKACKKAIYSRNFMTERSQTTNI